jgi:hypothetical protein
MATAYTPTATYSNLTRLELEALRRADFFAGGKALTVGDDGGTSTVVGRGNINAEPFLTGPEVALDDLFPLTPVTQPGYGIGTQNGLASFGVPAEYVQWLGPQGVYDSEASGVASGGATWQDNTPGLDFTVIGVQAGDLLLITPTAGTTNNNAGTVATISVVAAAQLTLTNIWNPVASAPAFFVSLLDKYNYTIVRPSAIKLFALPGSGALGREQTFMVVNPTTPIHNQTGPSLASIEAARLPNIVPAKYGVGDRADWVYDFGTSRATSPTRALDSLGYRVVFYPDVGDGSGPDLTRPITSLNPVIDPALPLNEQRLTIDYKAGIIRLSCAPALGGDLKPSGATDSTNPLTGRLNLYAVLWTVDLTLTQGNARTLYGVRTTNTASRDPGRVVFNATTGAWQIGATGLTDNQFYVKALGSGGSTNPYYTAGDQYSTEFGTRETVPALLAVRYRYFVYRPGSNEWRFVRSNSYGTLSAGDAELVVADKTALTLGDISNPAQGYGGDLNASARWDGSTDVGARDTSAMLGQLSSTLLASSYGTAHLRKGRYYLTDKTVYVPPGSTIQGEGAATKIFARINSSAFAGGVRPAFKVGPNTPWGVWDSSSVDNPADPYGVTISPTVMSTVATSRIEGADLVWNPVRRVWGQVIALDNDVWFNEIGPTGAYRFPGLGFAVKDTAANLWTTSSPLSTNHTGGHYPRIAHHEHTDEYSVVWVERASVGGITGPQVRYRAFLVDLDLAAAAPAPSLAFNSASFLVGSALYFQDHPSIAVEGYTTGSGYTAQVTFWEYGTDAGGLVNVLSGVARRLVTSGTTLGATNTVALAAVVPGGELPIVSSTDTKWDGNQRFLTVWSVRNHRLLAGAVGSLTSPGSFLHNAVYNLLNIGIRPGSKLHILTGATTAFGAAEPFLPATQNATTLTINLVLAGGAVVYHDLNAPAFSDAGPLGWAITPASYIQGALTNWGTSTFSAATDVVNGQKLDDDRFYVMEMDQPDFVRLSRGGDRWLVVYQGFRATAFLSTPRLKSFADSSLPLSYFDNLGGTPAGDLRVYREHVSTCRVLLADNGALIFPSPANQVDPTNATRSTGPSALVHQPISSGGGGVITLGPSTLTDVVASFNNDFDTVNSVWGETRLDGKTYLSVESGVNVGMWEVLSHTNTTIVINGTFFGADAGPLIYSVVRVPAGAEARLSRDTEVSGKSLGTRPPLTTRPNYNALTRHPMNEAREVAALNFMYPWGFFCPSLMPAVTWTGQDWVVVSPAKSHLRSFTGCYHPNGPNSLFADAGWYFGTGVQGSRVGGTLGTLVKTWPTGAKIYDVATNTYLSINSVYDEHTVVLSGATPLGGVDLTNQIYYLVLPSMPDAGGFKNQGFRVAADGQVVASTSYITFADPPAAASQENMTRSRELMRRVFSNYGSAFFPGTMGANYPATGTVYDVIEEASHRKGDIYFNGVAVGRPKGVNELGVNEPPVVALAWGENFFGFVDRITAGDTSSRVRQVEFYRQSFGPYNVTIKDLAIDVGGSDGLTVLSRAHVYTNHGGGGAGTVAMATDGYRNVYVYPTKIQSVVQGSPSLTTDEEFSRLYACYTNAEGHHSLHLEAGRPAGNEIGVNWYRWQQGAQYQGTGDLFAGRYTFQNPTAKVLWDGKRFVVAYVAKLGSTGILRPRAPFVLSLGSLPGEEDGGPQTNEVLSPVDTSTDLTPLGSALLSAGGGAFGLYDDAATIVIDMAFSGTTYAVLWVAGCVCDEAVAEQLYSGSVIGVTIFKLDNAVPASGLNLSGQFFPGGGQTFVLGQSQFPGTWGNPRIIWTGEKYTAFAQQTSLSPAYPVDPRDGDSSIVVAHFGPDGPAEPTQVKQQIGRHGGFGSLLPVNNATPLYNADLVGLGTAYFTSAFSAGAPSYGQEFTIIMMTGGGGEAPTLASGVTGAATLINVWTDLAANFLQGTYGPVQPGDLLRVTDVASANVGIYVIQSVTATTLAIDLPVFSTPEGGLRSYSVVRPSHPAVQPGDVLVVDGVWDDVGGTLSTESTGHYPVLNYNPKTRALRVEGQFAAADIDANGWRKSIRGSIRTGSTANLSLGSVLAPGRTGSTQQPVRAGEPSWLTDRIYSGGYSVYPSTTKMGALLDVAYNAARDEYAVLFTSLVDPDSPVLPRFLWVAIFDPRKRQFTATTPVIGYEAGSLNYTLQSWRLHYNGRHYLATGAVLDPPSVSQYAVLLSEGLAIEQRLNLNDYLSGGAPTDLVGNLADQVPGAGYGGLFPVQSYPLVRGTDISWNSALARWVISSCFSWNPSPWVPTTNMVPRQIPLGNLTAWGATSTTVSVANTAYLLPGMKVLFANDVLVPGVPYYLGYATVLSVTNGTDFVVDLTRNELDTGAGFFGVVTDVTAFILPREDVFTWTVGYTAAGISLDDADGVTIENVTFSGQSADVTERWSNMARPIWQAAGQTTGLRWGGGGTYTPTIWPFNQAERSGYKPPPQYNHRLLKPEGKVETTHVKGLRSSSKLRFDPSRKGNS